MGIATAALIAYVSSSQERLRAFSAPLLRLLTDRRYTAALLALMVAIPAGVAGRIYLKSRVALEAPSFARTVHPAPPAEITVGDSAIDLIAGHNPFRELEETDPDEFRRRVESGRDTYYRNCLWCHGDDMSGNGMFIHGLNPIPTNFTDAGTIAMLQETFLFWRIAKGGPGMPEEGGPWDSAMPAWEKFLSEEEIWEVILFLYDFTGYRPRASEVHE
jgi:mono/diheme cytochrome c family protein